MAYSDDRETYTALVDVSVDDDLSLAVPLGGLTVLGIMPPSAFAATTARLLFHVSMDGSTYQILRDNDGTVVAVVVAATNTNLATYLDPAKFAPWRFLKIGTYKSDESTAVSQASDKSITLIAGKVTG